METLDIIDLIEKNPITKLSDTYNNKLLTKIKENFNRITIIYKFILLLFKLSPVMTF